MKSYIRISLMAAIIFVCAVVLFGLLTAGGNFYRDDSSREEISVLNDIARTAEEHRSELNILDSKAYSVNYVILDMTDNVLYSNSVVPEKLTVEKAIQNRFPYRYLTYENTVWGSVVILDDGMNGYRTIRNRFIAGMCICGLLILLGTACLGAYLQKNIISPFGRMKDFAAKIADGKLDEPLEMDKEHLFGAFSESFDIMREELSESKSRELALQKKEREMVASLSHDLKTPVTGIKLAAELLQMRISVKSEAGTDEMVFSKDEIAGMSEDAESIRRKAEQIDVLVTDLFTSALDDLGEFKVNCRDENSGVLCDIVKSYDDKGLVVIGSVPAVIINIDTKRMAQVIGNIISNSYKYANTAIDISFRISESFLEMRIQDHGSGVPADEIDLITNKFYRGKSWRESNTDGNGLGLYIAKMLMNKMNGDMIAESRDGLAVTLVIPLS